MRCCLTAIFLALISRVGIILWWLANPLVRNLAFENWVFPAWLWTLAGAIFLPWTTLAYLLLFQGGIAGFKWIVLVVAFLIDLAGHGGSYHNRRRVRGYFR
jgi:hypothetical protein